MSDWREGTLSDIAEVIMGQSPKGDTCNEDGNGLPLLNGPTEFGADHPFPTQFTTDPKKFAKKGDVLFCVRGSTTGRMNWANQEYAIGRGIASIRSKSNKYNSFIYHLLNYRLPYLLGIATGSTFPNVTKDHINELPINIPDSLNLEFINNTLFKLDNKITLLRQQNQDLEELAQVLFKRWFVEFEFPNENGETYKSSGGKMVESELGEIPEGWKVGRIGDIYKTTSGGTPSRKVDDYYCKEGIPWIKSKELNDVFVINTEEKISEKGLKKSSAKSLPKNTVLVAMYGATVGQLSITFADKMTCNQAICAILEGDYSFPFIYQLLKYFKKDWTGLAIGSAQQNLSQVTITGYEIVIPSVVIEKSFTEIIKPLYKSIRNNFKEIQTLTQLRDTLLPKLMSGELRVKM